MNSKNYIKVRILFFAKTRELAGSNNATLKLESPEIVVADLLNEICSTFNLDIIKQNIILAVNGNYCENLQTLLLLKEGDEIAVIPPISGG